MMTGIFKTTFGTLALNPSGGRYDYQGGQVTATEVGATTMDGKWTQIHSAQQCPDGSYSGKFHFDFTSVGFDGSYGYCDDPPGSGAGGAWTGTRVLI
jgi:hypothetical protein